MSDIEARVKQIFSDHLGWPLDKITDNAVIIDDLGADSLDLVELVMAAEEELGIEISDHQAEQLLIVNDAVKFITRESASMPKRSAR